MKHQQVTNILKKAGFNSRKTVWENGRRVVTSGYSVRQFGKGVGIDCCFCMADMPRIQDVLKSNGFIVSEIAPGGGMLRVTDKQAGGDKVQSDSNVKAEVVRVQG